MRRKARVSAMAGISAAVLAISAVAGAGPASAATDIYVNAVVSKVTGTLTFNPNGRSFTATNVTLYDTSCDNRSAIFWFETNNGSYGTHQVNQCFTSATWSSLTGTDGGEIEWVRVNTEACNGNPWTMPCSGVEYQMYDNPYT
jgi:hypothetical protein